VAVVASPVGQYEVIALQTDQPPFDDLRVRQALKHCLDRPAIVQAVLQGWGVVGNDQPLPPSDPFWADLAPLAYDLERAKALLAEAG
jgi:peptide/nickel transport system substrate-binding protein